MLTFLSVCVTINFADEVKDEPPPSVSQSATNIPATNIPSDLPVRVRGWGWGTRVGGEGEG